MDKPVNVICNSFWEFKKLLKLLYSEGYKFPVTKQTYGAVYFWVLNEARGLAIYPDTKSLCLVTLDIINYIPDYMTYKWYLKNK